MIAPQSLASRVADLPDSVATSVKKGFSTLASLPPLQRGELTDKVIELSLNGRSTIDLRSFADDFNLDTSQSRNVMNAISSFISLSSETDVDAEIFLNDTSDKLYDADQRETAREILRLVTQKREQLKRSLDLSSVASETLPSFRAFFTTVDLRPKFDGLEIVDATPVSLVHISTDTSQELWMQLTAADIGFIQDNLSDALNKMNALEKFYANNSRIKT